MFTGIVREVGTVERIDHDDEGARLRVRAGFAGELETGASVAVAGACLTVAELDARSFAADVMNQTLSLTTLGELEQGSSVNLEPALLAGDPLGGHLVQGHVDATAEVRAIEADGIARRLRISLPPALARYVIEHGSITLDGVSLTIAGLSESEVEVSLIPETLERTTLGEISAGNRVNVEVDQIARYAERLMSSFGQRGTDG